MKKLKKSGFSKCKIKTLIFFSRDYNTLCDGSKFFSQRLTYKTKKYLGLERHETLKKEWFQQMQYRTLINVRSYFYYVLS